MEEHFNVNFNIFLEQSSRVFSWINKRRENNIYASNQWSAEKSYLVRFGGAGACFPFLLVGRRNCTRLLLLLLRTGPPVNVLSLLTAPSDKHNKYHHYTAIFPSEEKVVVFKLYVPASRSDGLIHASSVWLCVTLLLIQTGLACGPVLTSHHSCHCHLFRHHH